MDELEAELALSKATVIDLRTKVDLLEINNEEKINEEKEKIVQEKTNYEIIMPKKIYSPTYFEAN